MQTTVETAEVRGQSSGVSGQDGTRPLAQAVADAEAFRALFPPACYRRWEVAGSCRRGRPVVGDVEHVVIPAWGEVPATSLFAEATDRVNLLWYQLEALERGHVVSKHLYGSNPDTGRAIYRWGPKHRGADFRGFNHEIFTADADNWGSVLAIRTGPGPYSRMLVTRLQHNGYMNADGYVWDKNDWSCADCGWAGAKPAQVAGKLPGAFVMDPEGRESGPLSDVCPTCGRHQHLSPAKVPAPEEREYFRLCGVAYVEPERRG